MQFLLSFILFCFINTPLLSADVEDIGDLERGAGVGGLRTYREKI
jgi:hypothetical protein